MAEPTRSKTETVVDVLNVLVMELAEFIRDTDEDGLTAVGFDLITVDTRSNGKGIILAVTETNDGEPTESHLLEDIVTVKDVGFEDLERIKMSVSSIRSNEVA